MGKSGLRKASRPDDQVLDAMVTHIAYEVAALENASARCDERLSLESFLLHARILRDFFWTRWDPGSRFANSEILAEHYFASRRTWSDCKGRLPTTLKNTTRPIDKQLAHITRERIDPAFAQDLRAAVPTLKEELLNQWQVFLSKLDTDPRRARFEEGVAHWRSDK